MYLGVYFVSYRAQVELKVDECKPLARAASLLDNCDANPARYCGGDCQRKHWTGEGTPDEPSHKVRRCRCTPSKQSDKI